MQKYLYGNNLSMQSNVIVMRKKELFIPFLQYVEQSKILIIKDLVLYNSRGKYINQT